MDAGGRATQEQLPRMHGSDQVTTGGKKNAPPKKGGAF